MAIMLSTALAKPQLSIALLLNLTPPPYPSLPFFREVSIVAEYIEDGFTNAMLGPYAGLLGAAQSTTKVNG
jgi:hypothetical protein